MDMPAVKQGLDIDTLRRVHGTSGKSDLMQIASIAQDDSEEGLKLAAKEFTGMFLGQIMKAMRSTVEVDDIMHGGQAEDTFQGMLDDEWTRNMAYNGNVDDKSNGFVGVVYDSLKRRSAVSAYNELLKAGTTG